MNVYIGNFVSSIVRYNNAIIAFSQLKMTGPVGKKMKKIILI